MGVEQHDQHASEREPIPSRPSGTLGLEETVDLAGVESFPASDAPSWSPTHAGSPALAGAIPQGPELLHEVVQRIRDDVHLLARGIGERNDTSPATGQNLREAATAIEKRFRDAGLPVKRRPAERVAPSNVEAVILGKERPAECIIVGAHYDTVPGSPDNATGVAALLALARSLQEAPLARTVRLVAFVNEESPDKRSMMGNARYVDALLREGPQIAAMLSLEMLGVFTTAGVAVDFDRVGRATTAIAAVVRELANAPDLRREIHRAA